MTPAWPPAARIASSASDRLNVGSVPVTTSVFPLNGPSLGSPAAPGAGASALTPASMSRWSVSRGVLVAEEADDPLGHDLADAEHGRQLLDRCAAQPICRAACPVRIASRHPLAAARCRAMRRGRSRSARPTWRMPSPLRIRLSGR